MPTMAYSIDGMTTFPAGLYLTHVTGRSVAAADADRWPQGCGRHGIIVKYLGVLLSGLAKTAIRLAN